MVSRGSIDKELQKINYYYNRVPPSDINLPKFYSKLALLELCGWIEQSMDDLIFRYTNRRVKETANLDFVHQDVIGKTYGFEYERYFRTMLIRTIGIVGTEKLEKSLNHSSFNNFCLALKKLKEQRDPHSHATIFGTTIPIDAPSQIIAYFESIYPVLKEFERSLKGF